MPAPFTIVTFVDRDGDEFPVRVSVGHDASDGATEQAARTIAQYLIDEGSFSPNGPLRVASIERSEVAATQEP